MQKEPSLMKRGQHQYSTRICEYEAKIHATACTQGSDASAYILSLVPCLYTGRTNCEVAVLTLKISDRACMYGITCTGDDLVFTD